MFGWCCQDQQQINEQLFVYRSSSDHNSRQLINISQLNSAILKQDQKYQVFVSSPYESLLKTCRQRKEDFADHDFDIRKQQIPKIKSRTITWKRLKQFGNSSKSQLFQPRTMTEIVQLNQNDSYFLASIAALSERPANITAILDGAKSFSTQGIYKLNVCVSGQPKQIVIDDFVPVFADNLNRTAFTKAQQGALWVLLLEKAYAKLRGGYNNIVSGFAHEVLATFTIAPCLNHIIPLSFDPASQQLLWIKLIQARKNKFPVVCGSRKRYTCKGIIMNHAYPLVDCSVEQSKGHRQRIVKLINNPTDNGQCEHNGECSFVVDGEFLKLELVEFMRNFELIDVAHLRSDFNSHFYSYKSFPGQFMFYGLDVPENSSFYLTLQHNSQEKGRVRLFLARIIQNSITDFQLISCKSEEYFSDASLECFNLPQGRYIVCCQSSLKADCFLRVYSEDHLILTEIKQDPIKFLEHIFFDYALSNKEGFYALSKNSNDWYYSKAMFEEIGLGCFIVNLHSTSNIKCYLSYKKDELEKEGFNILNKNDKIYKVELIKSDIEILIFEMSGVNQECLEFPPHSLEIKVVI